MADFSISVEYDGLDEMGACLADLEAVKDMLVGKKGKKAAKRAKATPAEVQTTASKAPDSNGGTTFYYVDEEQAAPVAPVQPEMQPAQVAQPQQSVAQASVNNPVAEGQLPPQAPVTAPAAPVAQPAAAPSTAPVAAAQPVPPVDPAPSPATAQADAWRQAVLNELAGMAVNGTLDNVKANLANDPNFAWLQPITAGMQIAQVHACVPQFDETQYSAILGRLAAVRANFGGAQ